MDTAFFSDLLTSIAERGRALLGREASGPAKSRAVDLLDLANDVVSGRGEASGVALAVDLLERYALLGRDDRVAFFSALAEQFGPDQVRTDAAIGHWRDAPSEATATALHYAAEPRRQELFRRLNRAPGGTSALVHMREDLLGLLHEYPDLRSVDGCLQHLFASWFNRGFLVLRRIDWSTPASVLEKIIRYEAVHEIHDWDDLRRRIDPPDRRCYAFFHPALIDEPLIFVEVALMDAIPDAIAPLLSAERAVTPARTARTAVFYSISNCQQGLQGISFGNFLIKQVVEELRRELPALETFVTLSPVPNFARWLAGADGLSAEEQAFADAVAQPGWANDPTQAETFRKSGETLAARYFLLAKRADGRPMDSVARFHLGNGARLERIDWLGDRSPKALRSGAGLMVNYLYDLDAIEENHEAYANQGIIAASAAVRRLTKAPRKVAN